MAEHLVERGTLEGHTNWVTSIATNSFYPNMVVSSSRDKTVMVWDITKADEQYGVPRRSLHGHNHFVSDVQLSQDGQFAISSSWDNSLRLWELGSGRTIYRYVGHSKDVLSTAFSPDNRQIVSTSRDRSVKLWNTISQCKLTITGRDSGHKDWVSCVRFSPIATEATGSIFCTASWDKTVKVWGLSSSSSSSTTAQSNDLLKCTLEGHTGYLNTCCISPDGSLCASGGRDTTALLYDLTEGKRLYHLPAGDIITALAFSPNKYWLCTATASNAAGAITSAASSTSSASSIGGSIKIWDLESKVLVQEIRPDFGLQTARAQIPFATCLTWSTDGSVLYAGYTDGKIRCYQITGSGN